MLKKLLVLLAAVTLQFSALARGAETFVGSFAEPVDGGNLDTARSTFDGATVTIVPRAHASEALNGATRWRNVLFAVRGVAGKAPVFRLPLTSPGTGRVILNSDAVSHKSIKMVWSYAPDAVKWTAFDTHTRSGTGASTWKVEAQNAAPFTEDIVYVSINEHFPVGDYYEWLESDVFTHRLVRPTPSESNPGTFVIGYQSGAPAGAAFSRSIPDMPLFGFVIRDPAANPTRLVMLVSGQHPYEGQNKVALQAAVGWILNSTSPEAQAYRAQYVTVVYPFVNPTGELAGLWRGTAYAPMKDTNRNWHTAETVPSRNRGIDTVIVHKNAMKTDIAALGLGEPYAVFDYHQNFGDRTSTPDYVLHASYSATSTIVARRAALTEFAPYFARAAALSPTLLAEVASDLTSQETLRGYMVSRGVTLPLTFERSVYNSIASEWSFGLATVIALVDPATVVVAPPTVEPVPEPPAEEPAPTPEEPTPVPGPPLEDPAPTPTEPAPVVESPPADDETPSLPATPPPSEDPDPLVIGEEFTGTGGLNRRTPDGGAPAGSTWTLETGVMTINNSGAVATNNSARAVIDAGLADGEVSTTLTLGASNTGLILRRSDSANYLRFVITSTGWLLQKSTAGGTATVLSGKATHPLGGSYTVSAKLDGATLTLAVNGVTVGTAITDFNVNATRHGLLSSGSGNRNWGAFSVRRLP